MTTGKTRKIGKYEILDVLGKGGMGVVYKAIDPAIGRLVAIKMITSNFADDPGFLRRFYREAQSTGKLQHQNIVIVHDLGEFEGSPFLVMEFLEGESVACFLKENRKLSIIEKLNLIIQTCNGLQYAHERNVVHRDIKPGNLMVLVPNNAVKIVDFGIARIEDEANFTLPNQVIGTIQYMSPEQIYGKPVDGRSDVFSTAVVLFQLLTRKLPFSARDAGSTLLKIINEPPPSLSQYMDNYPAELDNIMQRALAKSLEDRYQSAEEFALDLIQVQEQLRREAVSEYLKVVEDLLARNDLGKAREQCLEVVRIDRQNSRAKELLQEIQLRIKKQQRGEQAKQLMANAQEAFSAQDFNRALLYLDQAGELNSENHELQAFRELVVDAKSRAEQRDSAMKRAQSAQYAGDLTDALNAVEQVLALDASDTEACLLRDEIGRELEQRKRQIEIQGLIEDAQRQISSRRFTAALEALQRAQTIDPNAPVIRELVSLAASGQEQERRRKELERLTAAVQDALNQDAFQLAGERCEEALNQFPDDRGLLKLKSIAERQRQAVEKRHYIDEQIAAARKLLDNQNAESALRGIEAACARYPNEAALLSVLAIIKQTLQQERAEARKNECIQRSRGALRALDFDEAIRLLEVGFAEFNSADLEDLLQIAKEEKASFERRRQIDAAAEKAQNFLAAEDYAKAIQFLRGVLKEIPDEELVILLAEAERRVDEFDRRVGEAVETAERLLRVDRAAEAVRFLESQPQSLSASPRFREIVSRSRECYQRLQSIMAAVEKAQSAVNSQNWIMAQQIVDECRSLYGDHPELSRVASKAAAGRSAAATATVNKATSDSRMLLLGRSYESAMELLDSVRPLLELVDDSLRFRHTALCDEVQRGLAARHQHEEAARIGTPPDELTEERTPRAAPGTSGDPTQPDVLRLRDSGELRRLAQELQESTASVEESNAILERAQLLAKRHPHDMEMQSLARDVATALASRVESMSAARSSETDWSSKEADQSLRSEISIAQPRNAVQAAAPIEAKPKEQTSPTSDLGRDPVQALRFLPTQKDATPSPPEIVPEKPKAQENIPAPNVPPPPVRFTPEAAPKPEKIPTPPLQPRVSTSQRRLGVLVLGTSLILVLGGVTWRALRSSPSTAGSGAATGIIQINSVPGGATAKAQDKYCVTPACRIELPPGDYELKTSLPGYAPDSRIVHVSRNGEVANVDVALNALPSVVHVNTNLSGGQALLDGKPGAALRDGQLDISVAPSGSHRIRISAKEGSAEIGFEAVPASAPLIEAPIVAQNLSALAIANNAGQTHLLCNCADGSPVVLDGRPLDRITAGRRDLGAVPEGHHQIQVGEGSSAHAHNFTVTGQPALDVFLDAERDAGILVVETSVDKATVFIDGQKSGQTTSDGVYRTALPSNKVSVSVVKSGYQTPPAQLAEVKKNGETSVAFNLLPAIAKSTLVVEGGEPNAAISLDGKPVGSLDNHGRYSLEVSPGKHSVEFAKAGYDTQRLDMAFAAGNTERLHGEMRPIPQNTPPQREQPTAEVKPPTVKTPPPARPLPIPSDQQDWQKVHTTQDPEAFLERHPDSPLANQARERIREAQISSDRSAVLSALSRYTDAYKHKSTEELEAIWPSLLKQERKKIADSFKSAEVIQMNLRPLGEPSLSGDSAIVTCERDLIYTFSGGVQKTFSGQVTIRMRKKSGTWLIEGTS